MNFQPKSLLAAAGITLAIGFSSQAFASETLVWNPSATLPALAAQGPITFNDLILADYATIKVNTATNTFTETAFLDVSAFFNGPSPVGTTLNFQNGGFGLYFAVTAGGVLSGPPNTNPTGKFTSLTYTLYGFSIPGATQASFTFASGTSDPTASIPGGGTGLVLGTGTLVDDPNNSVSITAGVPTSTVDTQLTPSTAANSSGFYVTPPSNVALLLNSSFTNAQSQFTTSVVGTTVYYQVGNFNDAKSPGGGSATAVSVPEPGSLALIGAGLLGFGILRRRRNEG